MGARDGLLLGVVGAMHCTPRSLLRPASPSVSARPYSNSVAYSVSDVESGRALWDYCAHVAGSMPFLRLRLKPKCEPERWCLYRRWVLAPNTRAHRGDFCADIAYKSDPAAVQDVNSRSHAPCPPTALPPRRSRYYRGDELYDSVGCLDLGRPLLKLWLLCSQAMCLNGSASRTTR